VLAFETKNASQQDRCPQENHKLVYVVWDSMKNPQATDIACTFAATKWHMMAHAGGGEVDHTYTCAGSCLQGWRCVKKTYDLVGAQDRWQFAQRRIGDQLEDLRPV
jgi:hypothetical protein